MSQYDWPIKSYLIYNELQQQKSLSLSTNNSNDSDTTVVFPHVPPLPIIYQYETYGPNMTLQPWDSSTNGGDIFLPTLYMSPPPRLPTTTFPYMNINWYTDPKIIALTFAVNQINGKFLSIKLMMLD
jgi:hypothetical protein